MKKNLTNRITYISKLSGKFIWNLLKTYFIGFFFTAIYLFLGIFSLAYQIDIGKAGHVGPLPFLMMSVLTKPISSISFYLFFLISNYVLIPFSGNYALSKTINTLIKDKSDSFIIPVIEKTIMKIEEREPDLFKSEKLISQSKKQLINAINKTNENKIIKRIVRFGLKKINMDDIDFNNTNFSYTSIVTGKIINQLHSLSQPSYKTLWVVIIIQWIILGVLHFTPY